MLKGFVDGNFEWNFIHLIDLTAVVKNATIFDLNKSRQKFHHSLKEHHKISNIPKFRCEML
jgi:hypothetical protein